MTVKLDHMIVEATRQDGIGDIPRGHARPVASRASLQRCVPMLVDECRRRYPRHTAINPARRRDRP